MSTKPDWNVNRLPIDDRLTELRKELRSNIIQTNAAVANWQERNEQIKRMEELARISDDAMNASRDAR